MIELKASPIAVPKSKKLAYFDVSAEFFVERLKMVTDLPLDTTVFHIEANPNWGDTFGRTNIVRIYAESDSFDPVAEGQAMPQLDVNFKPPI